MKPPKPEVSGQVRSFTSEMVFEWSPTIIPGINNYQSPPLYSTDYAGVKHEWRLDFDLSVKSKLDDSGEHPEEMDTENYDDDLVHKIFKVTLQYLGDGQVPVYSISFRVIDKDCSRDLYKDCNEAPKSCEEMPVLKTFHKQDQNYVIASATTGYRYSLHYLEIVCKVCTHTNTGCMKLSHAVNVHDITLKNELGKLFENAVLGDVKFVIGNRELHLHKSILSSRSIVFAAMFSHDLKEKNSNIVNIEDLSYEAMKELFRYIYTAEVTNIEKYAGEILIAADKYAVDGLKLLCERELIQSLTHKNVLPCLSLAHRFNVKELEAQCVNYLTLNARSIVAESFYTLEGLPINLATKLYKALALKEGRDGKLCPNILPPL
ncbi:hypothetical protein QAD02_010431 [Eretmocerus hayati]|uniref:Uncharacterized protein n=1 Tax=Eretmocerus hayati TaxID=131215 RepID=A0ACC2NTV2_9HYME|nr:hypothetical protein QAD02_010431 [Eretmocerus hayati]